MKKCVLTSACVLACGMGAFADPSPDTALFDPDDQLRYIDELHYGIYDRLIADGFNTFIHSTFVESADVLNDPKANAAERSAARSMTNVLARCERDQINFIENAPSWGHRMNLFLPKYQICDREGNPVDKGIEASNPGFQAEIRRRAEIKAKSMVNQPRSYVGTQVSCEVRAHNVPSHSTIQSNQYFQATGRTVPPEAIGRLPPNWKDIKGFPKDRIIDENDPILAYYRWFWTNGDGWNVYNDTMVDAYQAAFGSRPLITLYSPSLRAPQFWGSGGKVTYLSDWSYANPFPAVVFQIAAEQQAMARGSNQRILSTVQAISWRRDIAGPDKALEEKGIPLPQWCKDWPKAGFPTMPPDLMNESIWLAWAHRVDGIGFHGWNSIYDGRPLGQGDAPYVYAFTHPGTQRVISNLFHTVGIPLGPYFKAVPERKPDVGMLISYASELFGGTTWEFRGDTHRYGLIAAVAGASQYVIYDDEISRDGIPPSIKVMLLRNCQVLTRTTCEKLKEFQRRGGKIFADRLLAPGLKADVDLPLEPYDWNQPKWFEDFGRTPQYLAAMKLKAELAKVFEPAASCDNTNVIVHVRQAGAADLVFAVNDGRKFGTYVGQWHKCLEEGVPTRGELTLSRQVGAVYDLARHASVPFRIEDGKTKVALEYSTSDGRVLLACDKPLKPLRIRRADGDAIRVETLDADVMIPIGVFPADGKPRYGVLKNGKWTRRVPGGAVKVRNLATGEWFVE